MSLISDAENALEFLALQKQEWGIGTGGYPTNLPTLRDYLWKLGIWVDDDVIRGKLKKLHAAGRVYLQHCCTVTREFEQWTPLLGDAFFNDFRLLAGNSMRYARHRALMRDLARSGVLAGRSFTRDEMNER